MATRKAFGGRRFSGPHYLPERNLLFGPVRQAKTQSHSPGHQPSQGFGATWKAAPVLDVENGWKGKL